MLTYYVYAALRYSKIRPFWLKLAKCQQTLENLKSLPAEIDFNIVDGKFNTILYLAAANNYSKTVNYLLTERKVNPNVKVSEKLTACHIAAASGHIEVLTQLVKCEDIKLAEKDQFGETPLFRALGNAPEDKLYDAVNLIVAADPSAISVANEDGMLPIDLALQRQQPKLIKLLLDNGADVNKRCSQVAANMMMSKSVTNSNFGGNFVFYTGTKENDNLRKCAKLIIEAYNKQHLAEDLKEMVNSNNTNEDLNTPNREPAFGPLRSGYRF